MTNRTCPIGSDNCYKCAYRQEVNDCGYDRQDTKPTLLFAGVTTAQEFKQALLDGALGEYRYQGFSLVMDEPILILRHEGELAFVFGEEIQSTIQAIHTACYLHLLSEAKGA